MIPGVPTKRLLGALRWRPGRLARNSVFLLGWMLLRAAAQATTIFVLARTLGGADYGKFVAILAVASFLTPFIGLGLAHIVLRNGAKDSKRLPTYCQYAAYWWAITLLPIIVLSLALAELLLPSGFPRLAAYFVIAVEMGATSLTELYARSRQAAHHINLYGAINAGLPLIRLLALGFLLLIGHVDIHTVLWTYAGSSLAYAALFGRRLKFSNPRPAAGTESMNPTSGLPLSLSTFSMRLQGEFNKPVLAHLGFDAAGAYNIAQRATEFITMPLQALQESLWPRLYAHADPRRPLLIAGAWLFLLAALGGYCVWMTAPLLPAVFGPDFSTSAAIMRHLAWLPMLQAVRALVNFYVIYHGRMPLIGWACAAGAAFGVASVTLLVPVQGPKGAVTAAYVSEVVMIFWLIVGLKWPKR